MMNTNTANTECKHTTIEEIGGVMTCSICEPVIRIDTKDVAKIMRAELKKAFPGFKFSVKTSSYSMGSHVEISYTDGPSPAAVEEVVGKFHSKTFDGSDDSTHYHKSIWEGKKVSFGGSAPNVSRRLSANYEETMKTIKETLNDARKYFTDYDCERDAWYVLHTTDFRFETYARATQRFIMEGRR